MSIGIVGLRLLIVLIPIIVIVFWWYIIHYINRLEHNCECSKDKKRDYVKYYAYFAIFATLTSGFAHGSPIEYLYGIISIIGIYMIYTYIQKLKRDKCTCSEEKARRYLEIVNYFQIAIISISIVVISGSIAGIIRLTKK